MTQQQSYNIIDQINRVLTEASKVPFTNKVMVESAKIIALVHELEESMPDDLAKARNLLSNEAAIIAEARQNAEDMVNDANGRARKTVDDANRQAQATQANAETYAADKTRAADDQAASTISAAQQQAAQIVAEAQRRAEQMISEHEITARAHAQAERIVGAAQADGDALRQHAYDLSAKCMNAVDEALLNQINSFRAARELIEQSQAQQE